MGCVAFQKQMISIETFSSRNKTTNSISSKENMKQISKDDNIYEIIREGVYFTVYKILQNGKMIQITTYENEKGKEKLSELNKLLELVQEFILPINSIKILEKQIQVTSEYAGVESLLDRVTKCSDLLSEHEIKTIMKQIFSALEHAHSMDIVLRDVCPENILMSCTNKISIAIPDMGVADLIDRLSLGSGRLLTNPFFIAPELLNSKCVDKSDIWSCGVLIYQLVTGYYPCSATQYIDYITGRHELSFNEDSFQFVSKECLDLLCQLLKYNPEERPSVREILNHEWFAGTVVTNQESQTHRQNVKNMIKQTYCQSRLLIAISAMIHKSTIRKKNSIYLKQCIYLLKKDKQCKINISELSQILESILSEIDTRGYIDKYLEKNDESKLTIQNFIDFLDKYNQKNTNLLEKAYNYFINLQNESSIDKTKLHDTFEMGIIYDNVILKEGYFNFLITELEKSELLNYSFDEFLQLVYLACDYFNKYN
jgi:calcium-dependent protein kinase